MSWGSMRPKCTPGLRHRFATCAEGGRAGQSHSRRALPWVASGWSAGPIPKGRRRMDTLLPIAARAGALLKARGETIAVAESSIGGLVSAALLAVPGASAYFLGGTV